VSKIIVDQALVDEGAATRTLVVSNIPAAIQRAVMAYVKGNFYGRDRDSAIVSEAIAGAVSVTYATGRDRASAAPTSEFYAALQPLLDL
jgi:hypothetical protein